MLWKTYGCSKIRAGTHVMDIGEWKRISKKRHLEHQDEKRKCKTA